MQTIAVRSWGICEDVEHFSAGAPGQSHVLKWGQISEMGLNDERLGIRKQCEKVPPLSLAADADIKGCSGKKLLFETGPEHVVRLIEAPIL